MASDGGAVQLTFNCVMCDPSQYQFYAILYKEYLFSRVLKYTITQAPKNMCLSKTFQIA